MYTVRLWLVLPSDLRRDLLIYITDQIVSRPLFVEEHGLRLLLEKEGVGIELSRSRYESGDWADTIETAWRRGRDKKAKKREEGLEGESVKRQQEIRKLAETVLRWTEEK